MTEVRESVEIARPKAEVWAVLADFGALADWAPNVDHSWLASVGDVDVGAVRRVQVGRNALLERIVEWHPGESLGYELEGLPPIVRSAVNRWSLEGDDGSTTAVLTTAIDTGARPPQRAIGRVVGRTLAKASRQMLDGLKAHLEQSS